MNNVKFSLSDFCSQIEDYIDSGMLNNALVQIKDFVETVIFNPRSVTKVFSSPELDGLCEKIAQKISETELVVGSELLSGSVVIATELHSFGGHVGVLESLFRQKSGGEIKAIILTNLFERMDQSQIDMLSKKFGVQVLVCSETDFASKLYWIIKKTRQFQPENLILVNHHQDSVAIAGALASCVEKVIFLHHADHNLALGVTCKHFFHVDLHNMGFFFCRENLGLTDNFYWPITFTPRKKAKKLPFLKTKFLTTCSSGRESKFTAISYRYDYFSFIPDLLVASGGKHIHIGPLSESKIQEIKTVLVSSNIDLDRFIHINSVSSIYESLIDLDVDLYISSFPLGGGMASIEAMAAGIPLLIHNSYRSRFFGGVDIAYPNAFVWKDKTEFIKIIKDIDLDDLKIHSSYATAHFEKYYNGAKNLLDIQDEANVPTLKSYTTNSLQSFLDDEYSIELELANFQNGLKQYRDQAEFYEEKLNEVKSELNYFKNSYIFRLQKKLLQILKFFISK